MKQLGSIVAVVVLSAYSLVSSAGPDKTTKLLMDTPASMFDLGMIRLQTYFTNASLRVKSPLIVTVKYNWDDDKIAVNLTGFDYEGDKIAARNECLKGFENLRMSAGVEEGTSKIHDFLPMSFWEEKFIHVDYDQAGIKGKLTGHLDKKFILKCSVYAAEGYSSIVELQSPLLSTSYSEISN